MKEASILVLVTMMTQMKIRVELETSIKKRRLRRKKNTFMEKIASTDDNYVVGLSGWSVGLVRSVF